MKNKIVVARYNEDVGWLSKLDQSKYDILVYNKGNDTVKYEYQKLENLGRESQTYLSYIIDYYHQLPDFTIFLQSNPFDHLGNMYKISDKPIHEYINSYIFDDKIFGFGIYHSDCGHLEERQRICNSLKLLNGLITTCDTVYSVGAQLIVPKRMILNKPIEFWMDLKFLHEKENDIVDFNSVPFIIERMWFQIFQ